MKRNRRFQHGLTAVLALLAIILGFSACSKAKAPESSGPAGLPDLDTSKRVELVLYVFGTEPPRQQEVDDHLNKILLEKLNCTLDVRFINLAEYNTTYPLLFSSGEVFDLAYCAYWLNFTNLAQRGAFMALDDLFPKYAPKNYARQSSSALQQATVDGHIYCIPSLMKVFSAFGPLIRMDLVEPYGFDGKMENYADLERYLDIIKANYPAIDPFEVNSSGTFLDEVFMYTKGLYAMDYFWIDPFQEKPKLMTYYEYPPIASEFLPMVQRFAQKGFYPRNALAEQSQEKFRFGNAASNMTNLEMYEDNYRSHQEWNLRFYNWVTDLSYQSFTQDVAVVPATSKNPERALALYDLITNDEEVFRALFYGIEGVSYEVEMENGQERIVFPDSDNFAISNFWAARTDEFFLQYRGGPPDMADLKAAWAPRIKDGVGAQKFKALTLDTTAISTEYAAVNNVMTQYWNPLSLGFVDPVAGLAEFKANMEAAGIERIREHYQKQIDEYIAGLK